MKRFTLALIITLLALPASRASENDEDTRLAAFFKDYLDKRFKLQPMLATQLGDRRFDDQLDDVSAKSRESWSALTRETLEALPRKVDYKKLSRSGQIDFEILETDLKRSQWLEENTKPFETDPRTYNDYISDSTYLLLTQSSEPRERNVRNCVARMAQIPRIVRAAKETLKNPPKVFVETAIRQTKGAISYYESGIFEIAGETPQLSDLKPAAKPVVAALKDYLKFLEEDVLPHANGDWRLCKDRFTKKLDLELDAGIGASEVLQDAEAEFTRVERDMYVIARQLWSQAFPNKPLPPDDEKGRRDTIRLIIKHFSNEHSKPDELVKDAKATIDSIRKFIRDKDILHLPDPDTCEVVEMPEFQRGNTTAYLNQAPALDPKARSVYAVSPPPKEWDTRKVESYLEEYNRRMIQILTIHEAYPGHYVQLAYSNRHPSLIRRVLFSGVFAEGWAVYGEQMMIDQGYGNGDLVLRLSQLKWYLRSVANAILDNKMHCTEMTDDEALQFLTQRAFQSEGEALGKIVRAKQSSCQLSTYFVGRMAFYKLRQQIEREQGDSFDLGRFHEAVLAHGTLPVKYLPELVRDRLKQPR